MTPEHQDHSKNLSVEDYLLRGAATLGIPTAIFIDLFPVIAVIQRKDIALDSLLPVIAINLVVMAIAFQASREL